MIIKEPFDATLEMARLDQVITASIMVRDRIQEFASRYHPNSADSSFNHESIANELLIQLLILVTIKQLKLFPEIGSIFDSITGNNRSENIFVSLFQAMSVTLHSTCSTDIQHGDSHGLFWNHPLLVLDPQAVDFLRAIHKERIDTRQRAEHDATEDVAIISSFLTSLHQLDMNELDELIGTLGEILLTQEERKKKGIYFTPREITDYMTRKALYTWISRKIRSHSLTHHVFEDFTPNRLETLNDDELLLLITELLSMRILDPAMGSGHFLVSCAKQACDLLRKMLKLRQSKTTATPFPKMRLPCCTIQHKEDLFDHVFFHAIHGVDLNPLAVKVARARMYLTWLEHSRTQRTAVTIKELNKNDYAFFQNLKVGNSLLGLVRPTDDKRALNDVQNTTSHHEKPFHWFLEFPQHFQQKIKDQGFDIIISNPPYLSLKSSKTSKRLANPNMLRKIFGPIKDIYECFITRADHLLNNHGIACFIIPNNIIPTLTRDFESKIISLENLGEKIFPDAPMAAVAIILWSKVPTNEPIALKNLVNTKNKIHALRTTVPISVPHLRWLREHPIVRILTKRGVRLKDLGIQVTRGEELGKKSVMRASTQPSMEAIPIFAATNMRFFGLTSPTYFIKPELVRKTFYDQNKLGFSISFRNRIKCSYIGRHVTFKSIICLHDIPSEWLWWLLLVFNSSTFDFYHRCTISWYQEKRTNTIAEIREFPVIISEDRDSIRGLENLVQFLVISYNPRLHRLLDLCMLEMIFMSEDAFPQARTQDLVLFNYLNEKAAKLDFSKKFVDNLFFNPLGNHSSACSQKTLRNVTKKINNVINPASYPHEINERIMTLERIEKRFLR